MVGAVDGDGAGVWGETRTGRGVVGVVREGDGAGVTGDSPTGDGVIGRGRRGVVGVSPDYQGVFGHSDGNAGVVGESTGFHAVFGISHAANNAGIFGTNTDPGGFAGLFDGAVRISGGLSAGGVDVVELLTRLQAVLPALEALVAERSHGPQIQVTALGHDDTQANFQVTGQNFRDANRVIRLEFRSAGLAGGMPQVLTDQHGNIPPQTVGVFSPLPTGRVWEVTAHYDAAPNGPVSSPTVTVSST